MSRMKVFLLIPVTLFFSIFTAWPLVEIIKLSFYKTNFISSSFVGLDNYIDAITDPNFLSAILNSLFYVLLLAPSQVIMGFLGAIVVFQLSKKWQDASRIIFYIPVLSGGIIIAQVWKWAFSADGPINWLLGFFNIEPIMWFSQSSTGILVVSFIVLVSSFGANVILILSSLLDIDVSLLEAGKIDGANSLQRITNIIIPSISSTLKVVFLVSTVAAFQIYETILMLCPYEYTSTMTFRIYTLAFKFGKYGQSSAEAIFLIIIVTGLLMIQKKIQNEKV
jgi:multiple sugar transport system permease protein